MSPKVSKEAATEVSAKNNVSNIEEISD